MTGAASRSALVSTADLQAALGEAALAVIDCRHDLTRPDAGRAGYLLSHIPGARFMHLDEDLCARPDGRNGRHPLPDPHRFAQALGRAGIGNATRVLAYDAQGGMVASRLWWMLRHWLGHDAVAVLDGGWDLWKAEGRPVTDELPRVAQAEFRVSSAAGVVDAGFLLERLGRDGTTIIDARSPDRFRGENETLDPVGGRIPGARNRFFRDNLGADGRFKPAGVLKAEFLAVIGCARPADVVHQCGSGVSACHNLLAMDVAGMPGSRLYAGSWSEWCSDPSRPVARGLHG